ncbi:MAG: DinB family protein [Myxococcales bacterium]|nr:DinB family protein [Myxococcales bacterium]
MIARCEASVVALAARLEALWAALARATPAQFQARPGGASSLGAHLRHVLDCVQAIVDGVAGGVVDYEERARGVPEETDLEAARGRVAALLPRLLRLSQETADFPLAIRTLLDPDGSPVELQSTLGRELAHALSHTVHHAALMHRVGEAVALPWAIELDMAPGTARFHRAEAARP